MIVAKPRRPWYQFSLLGMLIVITLASVPLGWLAYERNEVRKRAAAIARIEELNGKVVFGQRTSLSPQWLRTLLDDNSIGEVVSVNLIGTNFTDADIVHVARLKALKVLSLSHCQISDDGLAQLAGLTRLEKLWLDHTNLT
ncbi:MAG: hypothetical protein K8R36_11120, partial [Planctomycetales bacterium]|nr:hypothetical protein [Planctomycetales bacterium]